MKSHRSLPSWTKRKDRTTLCASFPEEKRYKVFCIIKIIKKLMIISLRNVFNRFWAPTEAWKKVNRKVVWRSTISFVKEKLIRHLTLSCAMGCRWLLKNVLPNQSKTSMYMTTIILKFKQSMIPTSISLWGKQFIFFTVSFHISMVSYSVQPFQYAYESESEDDSEDSNAEGNHRNDYPDTEEDNSE